MRSGLLKRFAAAVAAVIVVFAPTMLALGQARGAGQAAGGQSGQRGQAAAPAAPTPRWPDGKPRLGGEKGTWTFGGGGGGGGNTAAAEIPYQQWSRAIAQVRQRELTEPHTRCKPSGALRQFLTPYGVEFVHRPELQRMYIFDVGGPHSVRIIYMDGREHPKDLVPTYYGHNIGRWEGDTLVVDSVGYNEKMWFDRGASPHTEQLHLTERFTRTDMNTMTYELTIDDPGAYTKPFTRRGTFRFQAGLELFEYICQDGNLATEMMMVGAESADRSTPIVP